MDPLCFVYYNKLMRRMLLLEQFSGLKFLNANNRHYLGNASVFIDRDKNFVQESFKVISKDTVHDEAL